VSDVRRATSIGGLVIALALCPAGAWANARLGAIQHIGRSPTTPALAANGRGDAVIAWAPPGGGVRLRLSRHGAEFDKAVVLMPSAQMARPPTVQIDRAGNVLVLFSVNDHTQLGAIPLADCCVGVWAALKRAGRDFDSPRPIEPLGTSVDATASVIGPEGAAVAYFAWNHKPSGNSSWYGVGRLDFQHRSVTSHVPNALTALRLDGNALTGFQQADWRTPAAVFALDSSGSPVAEREIAPRDDFDAYGPTVLGPGGAVSLLGYRSLRTSTGGRPFVSWRFGFSEEERGRNLVGEQLAGADNGRIAAVAWPAKGVSPSSSPPPTVPRIRSGTPESPRAVCFRAPASTWSRPASLATNASGQIAFAYGVGHSDSHVRMLLVNAARGGPLQGARTLDPVPTARDAESIKITLDNHGRGLALWLRGNRLLLRRFSLPS
jgi:hypothetical protein